MPEAATDTGTEDVTAVAATSDASPSPSSEVDADAPAEHHAQGGLVALAVGALGVVFGDIGTSPLYTFQECLLAHKLAINEHNILAVLSLIFWGLTFIVSIKYVAVLMQADNKGEGGIMALLALVPAEFRKAAQGHLGLVSMMVIVGAALLFGDGVITPAISVLSAIEGLKMVSPSLAAWIVPITCAILLGLFAIQSRGTGALGFLFGPVMVLWFVTIGWLGLKQIMLAPVVLKAVNPLYALDYFTQHGLHGFAILGSVILAVTGGEALYADMAHFGKKPIRAAWWFLAFPTLLCCYFGQGALLLQHPEAAESSFFSLVSPGPATSALVMLATAATIIASQALISAAFTLAHQAIRLGYLPRMQVRHTSDEMEGQIYLPLVNWSLAIACLALVLIFRESGKLAAAFGLAVSGTMGITSVMFYYVNHYTWGWSKSKSFTLLAIFLAVDIPFFGSTCLKFFEGGWLPLALASVLVVIMSTFALGRALMDEHLKEEGLTAEGFITSLPEMAPTRLPGAAVFMSHNPTAIPHSLSHQVRAYHAIHEHVLLLTVTSEGVPYVPDDKRLEVLTIHPGIHRVLVRSGFMEVPTVPDFVDQAIQKLGISVSPEGPWYLLSREDFVATDRSQMKPWREELFAFLSRNAHSTVKFFGLPQERVLELVSRVDL